jgi:hypothetical protein
MIRIGGVLSPVARVSDVPGSCKRNRRVAHTGGVMIMRHTLRFGLHAAHQRRTVARCECSALA